MTITTEQNKVLSFGAVRCLLFLLNMDEPESTNSNMNIIKAEDVDDPPSPIRPLIV